MDFIKARITDVEHPEEGYAVLRFAGPTPMTGTPGQFVMVRGAWGTDPILPRAFSLVEVGDEGAVLVRAVGKGTDRLVRMRPGDLLDVMGPAGNGFRQDLGGKTPILVAGGVGVAPLVFLGEYFAAMKTPCLAIYGARAAKDLPLKERLETTGDLTLTTEDGSAGLRGVVTDPLQSILKNSGDESHIVFACGPHGMLEAIARVCAGAGVPCEVALESPMACGMGTCKGCAFLGSDGEYRYVCCDGPVFDAGEVFGGAR